MSSSPVILNRMYDPFYDLNWCDTAICMTCGTAERSYSGTGHVIKLLKASKEESLLMKKHACRICGVKFVEP